MPSRLREVPAKVVEPLPQALWEPIVWLGCEGAPIGLITMICMVGIVVIHSGPTVAVCSFVMIVSLIGLRWLAIWDPRATRVVRRARMYRGQRSGLLPARGVWGSRVVNRPRRRH